MRFFLPILLALTTSVPAAERLAGPVAGEIVRVVDGDTLAVRARIWIGQEIEVLVRLRGVDAPEKRGRCRGERDAAAAATEALAGFSAGGHVVLTEIEGDKYFGRVIADVAAADGTDLSAALIGTGLVRAYSGGRRAAWCPIG